jgi:hypothetical protein
VSQFGDCSLGERSIIVHSSQCGDRSSRHLEAD